MVLLLTGYVLLWVPSLFWPGYHDSPLGIIVALPILSVYLFHSVGIPGLLQHNGACGWGWCDPTIFGWVFSISFWLLVIWLLARFISSLTHHLTEGIRQKRIE
jgi:hypothetical protein